MPARPKTATVGLKVRMREPLRKKLEVAAKARKASLNNELVARLEQSFQDEGAFGGADLKRVALLMAVAFERAGQASEPNRKPEEWLTIPSAYIAAVVGVLRALSVGLHGEQNQELFEKAIKSRLLTNIAQENSGARKHH
jgi:hypothetical protein